MPTPKKLIAVQIAEGDPRKIGKNKLRDQLNHIPQATRGLPSPPFHLRGSDPVKSRARKAWKFWKEELEAMEQDFRPDAMMFEGACMAYARAVEAENRCAKEGMIIDVYMTTGKGEQILIGTKANPAYHIAVASWNQLAKFCSEFGLTPISRNKMAINKTAGGGEEDLMEMLSKPREPRAPIPSVN